MPSRTEARLSPTLGALLAPKFRWYLHRRRHRPGVRSQGRRDIGAYRLSHRNARLLRHEYQIRGRQLRQAVDEAAHRSGGVAENVVGVLEQRLDALAWRAGFASTVSQARRMVTHNDFTVDGGKVNKASYQVRPGQTIEVRKTRRARRPFARAPKGPTAPAAAVPYLEVDPANLRATLTRDPGKEEVPVLRGGPRR